MRFDAARGIADAVLHEGYLLYPYSDSALKNRQRWSFGALEPGAFLQTEFLIRGDEEARLAVMARFLCDGALGELASEELAVGDLEKNPRVCSSAIEIAALRIDPRACRIRARVTNRGELTMSGTQLLIAVDGGELISSIDPPPELRDASTACRNLGLYPVLVGKLMLAAPIILYDNPQLSPESPGDLFDATEIDEILSLRILTLTDEEKRSITDSRGRALLERTHGLSGAQLLRLHGGMRKRWTKGMRVRLRPGRCADIFDLALAGKTAVVESVAEDLEGQTHIAVSVDDDPGSDLGAFAHRFFFRPDELELLA